MLIQVSKRFVEAEINGAFAEMLIPLRGPAYRNDACIGMREHFVLCDACKTIRASSCSPI